MQTSRVHRLSSAGLAHPLSLGSLLLACWLALPPACSAAEPRPPNIVFLLADDLGWGDVGFHGSEIRTPHLDRLAARGARLEAFYVQPLCSPTRAALMTGRYPMRQGLQVGVVRPWAQYGLPLEERTLPQALKEAGYATVIVGKWHLGHFEQAYLPLQRGFDHHYGHYNGALDYFSHKRDGGFDWHRDGRANRDEGYSTVLLGNEAVRVIEQHSSAQPLFLYVAFNAPHGPLQALPEHLKVYESIPDQRRRTFAAMVHCLDEQIGRILAALEQRGLGSNTLVVLSSDNGGPLAAGATNGALRAGKGTLYEGGVRAVALAAWPGHIQPGTILHQPLHMVDWYPTLLHLAGASLRQPLPLDGRDLWPVLARGEPSPHEEILLNATPRGGALRAGRWKLVVAGDQNEMQLAEAGEKPAPARPRQARAQGARLELFDLVADLNERTNVAALHLDQVRALRAKLDSYRRQAVPPKAAPKAAGFKAPAVWGETVK